MCLAIVQRLNTESTMLSGYQATGPSPERAVVSCIVTIRRYALCFTVTYGLTLIGLSPCLFPRALLDVHR